MREIMRDFIDSAAVCSALFVAVGFGVTTLGVLLVLWIKVLAGWVGLL